MATGHLFLPMSLVLLLSSAVTAQEATAIQATSQDANKPVLVRVETERGSLDIEVDVARAPVTARNFLRYVDAGFYDGGQFHRSATLESQTDRPVRIEVIQASINQTREKDQFTPIPLERTKQTGLFHKDGTISMARGTADSARSSFFICINDQPSLDYGGSRNPDGQGFAAFGRVVAGMGVVRAIHCAPKQEERLTPPIKILRANRIQ